MKFASEEIRTTVVRAYLSGVASRKQLADIFGYTPASISNWVREYKQNNRLAPRPNGQRKACFSAEELVQLSHLLKEDVDLTLAEIKKRFGKQCTLSAIDKTVKKLGFAFKKNSKGKRTGTRKYKDVA